METILGLLDTVLRYMALVAIPVVLGLSALPMIKGNFKQGLIRLAMGIAGILVLVAGAGVLEFFVQEANTVITPISDGTLPEVNIPKK